MELKKNILLDLGGVLIDLNREALENAFEKLWVKKAPSASKLEKWELGKLPESEFYSMWNAAKWVMKSDIDAAWNSLLGELPQERIALLKKWKKKHNLYLVSNTNSIHMKEIQARLGIFGWKQFTELFEEIYLSHEMGKRKPNADFFKHVLKDADIKAEDCSYIDDTEEHTQAAAKLGIDSYWLDLEKESILDLGKAR